MKPLCSTPKRVAIFISGRGSNMQALVEAAKAPAYPAQIALVLSNRPNAVGLDFAARENIETLAIDHKSFAMRELFEDAVHSELTKRSIDLVCLAGFMRVLSAGFVEKWTGRLLNIHPSLLPAYRGLHTHARALADGVKIAGCTVHFVVPEMDAGPIIAQAAVPVLDEDDPESLARRVLEQEHLLYPLALKLAAEDALRIEGQRVSITGAGHPKISAQALRIPA